MSSDAAALATTLKFQFGAHSLGGVRRRLVRVSVPLADVIAAAPPTLPPLADNADGVLVRGLPESCVERLRTRSGLHAVIRQRYERRFADLDGGFDAYLAGFSSKSRATLKRKLRRFAEAGGGTLDVRGFHRPEQVDAFCRDARMLSALTYQERLLEAGLPADIAADMRARAACDAVRAWLLYLEGRPVAYLYAPAEGDTLLYAHLGYDPAVADLSPGTVLQAEAMRLLMAERRFRWFDFTEGDGQHKRQFATGSVASVDLLLLRPTLTNRGAAAALTAFDAGVALAKRTLERTGGAGLVRRLRR